MGKGPYHIITQLVLQECKKCFTELHFNKPFEEPIKDVQLPRIGDQSLFVRDDNIGPALGRFGSPQTARGLSRPKEISSLAVRTSELWRAVE